MKTAVTAQGPNIDAAVDPRFGRCAYFVVVDTDTMQSTAIENPNSVAGGGAGIQSAQLMADNGVQTVLTGNCGPKAWQTLSAAEIDVVTGVSGSVREAVERLQSGELDAARQPNVASHHGTGGLADARGGGMGGGMGGGRAARAAPAAPPAVGNALVAAVSADDCTGCGLCAEECPESAILVNRLATVLPERCTGCGQCITVCPQDAIVLQKG